jgi:hypothetical protein
MRGQVRIHQEKIIARRRKELLYRTLIVFIVLAVIVSGLSILSRLKRFAIVAIEVSGDNILSKEVVQNAALEKISGNYFGIFPRSNSLIYPNNAVAAAIRAMPPVREVTVKRRDLKTLDIEVIEREKEFVWCTAEEGEEACYMLDYDGLVFALIEGISSTTDFIYRGALAPEPLGKNSLPLEEFRRIRFFLEELEGLSVSPREAEISPTDYLTIYLERGGKIMVDAKDDLSVILGNIAAVITDKTVAPSLSEFLDRLDYIKLDSGNKVVYKMK